MKTAVLVFPGSNCDHDAYHALKHVVGLDAEFVWHKQSSIDGFDAVVIPGGFTYGDYLRTGAMAKLSPVMDAVRRFADGGGPVIGICNGFQILLEAGLLPGAMIVNESLRFVCDYVHLKAETSRTPFTKSVDPGSVLRIPVAHYQGNYYADASTLSSLEANGQVVFRYCDPTGSVTAAANPNGSAGNIAGICNGKGNVLGMMPHPERCAEAEMGSADGRRLFDSMAAWLKEGGR
ncbi:MAG: phosphoribosylformylglycinamidine synthase subunit PurQ [Deltaproteobacteria bacterium]|nr:MAG: phosphoribosylformylglycinamidine synthase subunit PurQ [Deltaproteobacteria bacterium]